MTTVIFAILSFLLLSVTIALAWRQASVWHSLPCPAWLAWLVERENPLFLQSRARIVLDSLDIQAGMKVLDAGCGPGRLTIPMAEMVGGGGLVVAVDLQSQMLDLVRARAEGRGLKNIILLQCVIEEDCLSAGAFDRAVLAAVLGEIPDKMAALNQLRNSLRPGGVLAISEIVADPHFQDRKKVRGLAAAAGYDEIGSTGNKLAFTIYFIKPED